MRYRQMARTPRAESTRWGGRAVSVLNPAAFPSCAGVESEVEYLSLTMVGTCVGCGISSEDMESDGWVTPDNYRTFLCLSCQHKSTCVHCGMTMTVQEVCVNSAYVGMFRVGEFVAQCTNPECSDYRYVGRVSVVDTSP